MRLRFSEIQDAQSNPIAYKLRKASGQATRIKPYPHRYVEYAIHSLHKDGRPVASIRSLIRSDLDRTLNQKFPGNPKLSEAMGDFDVYVDAYIAQGNTYMTGWRNVSVPLPQRYFPDLTVGGRVMRIDLSASGYAAWIFSRRCVEWTKDPRLPLIQLAVATELGVDVEEVTAGAYCFEDGLHHAVPYTAPQVDDALTQLCGVLDLIR